MIIVMARHSTDEQVAAVVQRLKERGFGAHVSRGTERIVIGAIGAQEAEKAALTDSLRRLGGVEQVVPILKPYKLVSRESHEEAAIVKFGKAAIGGNRIAVIAGPCTVENREMLIETAQAVKEAGASVLRGGAFKPRTSPYDFQGLGEAGLALLAEAREITGLPVVTEAREARHIQLVAEVADAVQIGARNMQNYDLLREAGQCGKPVLLKRSFAATVEEWLKAAEYVAASGTLNIVLCERGIRTFEPQMRNTLDLSAVYLAKRETYLPVIVDPSHATGDFQAVPSMSLAAIAAGADGLLIEVHPNPIEALCDGPQQLTPRRFSRLMGEIRQVAEAIGRSL
ncbi:MAG: 3-deoxy-7-phosphoheptulonate synthase [Candidatus Zipacnadales bacterium]